MFPLGCGCAVMAGFAFAYMKSIEKNNSECNERQKIRNQEWICACWIITGLFTALSVTCVMGAIFG